jgi:SAM-dependent methyltransferase
VHDWIAELKPGQRALDVGSGPGSFPGIETGGTVVALDEDVDAFVTAAPCAPGQVRVFAQSHRLPFAAGSFELVICHHSLEHIVELEETLGEIARVLAPAGRLYISVPNGYGLCDGVYRWVFEGGGHVNRFRRERLVEMVERRVGVKLEGWQRLHSSFAYLWRLAELLEAPPPGLSRRLAAAGRLPRRAITGAQKALHAGTRIADRIFGTDLSVYGWAFYFTREGGEARERPAYLNVCLYCGAGQPAAGMERPAPGRFRCACCNRENPYFRPWGNRL